MNEFDSKHPHEPAEAPILDAEGRCLVCCRMEHDRLRQLLAAERAYVRKLYSDKEAALAEVERLKRGDFTDAELDAQLDSHTSTLTEEDEAMLKDLEVRRDEKDRRIYYQNIVYAVCNDLDAMLGQRVVCGTLDEPSTGVQDGMGLVRGALTAAIRERDDARADAAAKAEQMATAAHDLGKAGITPT